MLRLALQAGASVDRLGKCAACNRGNVVSLEPQGAQSFELPADAATETTSAAILAELQATAAVDAVQVSPFGESIVVEPSPRVQVDAVEGLLATDVETYTDGVSGSASVSGQLFVVTTGCERRRPYGRPFDRAATRTGFKAGARRRDGRNH